MSPPGLIGGALQVTRALGLLWRERSLWGWCALPFALNVSLFGAAIWTFAAFGYEPLVAALQGLLAIADPSAWYQWLWVGPLLALAWAVRWLVIALAALLLYLLFTAVGAVIASPFLDVLSQKVERLRTGGLVGSSTSALRVVVEDAKRTAFLLAGWLALLLLGLVPGLQLIAAAALFVFSALFLSLDYTAYTLDRRGVSFRARRAWVWQHKWPLLGFGTAALATLFVPGVNFLALPVLVTAGTLLALELEPPS